MSYLNHPFLVCQITNFCNARCVHCFNNTDSWKKEKKEEIAIGTLEKYIVGFKNLSVSPPFITLSGGGEPTLHSQFPQIVEMLSSEELYFDIVTNGVDWSNWFENISSKNVRCHISRVIVSILAPGTKHNELCSTDSYSRLTDLAKACRANSIKCSINCSLFKLNIGHVDEMIDLFIDLGIDGEIFLYPAFPTPYLLEHDLMLDDNDREFLRRTRNKVSRRILIGGIDPFFPKYHRESCQALDSDKFAIDYSGFLRFCCNMVGMAYEDNESDVIGSIEDIPLLELLQKREEMKYGFRKHFLDELSNGSSESSKMTKCEWCILKHFRKIPAAQYQGHW